MSVDESLGDTVSVTVIATRFDDEAEIVRPPVKSRVEEEPVQPKVNQPSNSNTGFGNLGLGGAFGNNSFGSQNQSSNSGDSQDNNVIDIPQWMRQRK